MAGRTPRFKAALSELDFNKLVVAHWEPLVESAKSKVEQALRRLWCGGRRLRTIARFA